MTEGSSGENDSRSAGEVEAVSPVRDRRVGRMLPRLPCGGTGHVPSTRRRVEATCSMNCVRCGCGMVSYKKHQPPAGIRRHASRGLCTRCLWLVKAHASIDDYPRIQWPRDELLDEWVRLRDEGINWRDAAPRIGVSTSALEQALCRAVRDGDPRGQRHAFGRAS